MDAGELPSIDILLLSLRGKVCPACGRSKFPRRTLCRSCYMILPTRRRAELYRGVAAGYEQAVRSALDALHIKQPHWPDPGILSVEIRLDDENDGPARPPRFAQRELEGEAGR